MKSDVISEPDERKNGCNRPDRKRFTRKKLYLLLIVTLVIITVLLFLAVNIFHTPDLSELLRRAKLAKFPESIQNLQFETRPIMDNDPGEPEQRYLFIRFQAEPNDIDKFINNSPGIDKANFRPLVPLPDDDQVPA